MSVQLFVPKFRIDECLEQIRECLEKGWTGMGFKTVEIENRWKEYTSLPNAHFISSATAGLHLALDIMKKKHGWDDGDEIISTSLTFISSNHAIKYANLQPVFADVDEYLCLDPESVLSRITEKTRAVMFVGLAGNTGRYEEIVKICKSKGLILILDAAHMAGSRLHGNHVGQEADVTVFSFQAVKNMPTADSGMICFKDPTDDAKARKLTWLGINKDTYARTAAQGAYKWKYNVEDVGFKYHGNSVMASLALVALKYLDNDNAYRRQLATWYRAELESCSKVNIVPIAPGCESSTHLIQIRVQNRDQLLVHMNENGVFPGVHYSDNTEYGPYKQPALLCPSARKASEEVISLPMHMGVSKSDVVQICAQIRSYVA